MPRPPFPAKSESPTTATRVSGLGASGSSGFDPPGAAEAVDVAEAAAAIVIGPFLSPFDSSSDTLPVASKSLISASAQLCGLVCANGCAVCPLTPPVTGVTERASGNAVTKLKFWVIGCDPYEEIGRAA